MSNEIFDKLTSDQLNEFGALFGSPPVLSTENIDHYNDIWKNLSACFMPRDFLEVLLIKQVQNETWEIMRYIRHQTVGVERRFRDNVKFQIQRKRDQKARSESLTALLVEKTGRPAAELNQLIQLHGLVLTSLSDPDGMLQRLPTELSHNAALEAGLAFEEQLDQLINSAMRRRNNAVEQLEIYRSGLGQYWKRVSDEAIDQTTTGNGQEIGQIQASPPVVPGDGENQDKNPDKDQAPENRPETLEHQAG
ncbi:MAG TPA: hypothetical protein VGG11_08730 [Xanthobacteraceae bacterium]